MCGVIGYVPMLTAEQHVTREAFRRLLVESSVRGLHAVGLFQVGRVYRMTGRLSETQADEFVREFDPFCRAIAHTRYSTSGDWKVSENNQPIVSESYYTGLAFNGVIHMGTKEEFERDLGVSCQTDNDGEVVLRKVLKGHTLREAVMSLPSSATFAGCLLSGYQLTAFRNAHRPLWTVEAHGGRWFASTQDIFRRAGFGPAELVQENTPWVG